jgi:hypothetical protein
MMRITAIILAGGESVFTGKKSPMRHLIFRVTSHAVTKRGCAKLRCTMTAGSDAIVSDILTASSFPKPLYKAVSAQPVLRLRAPTISRGILLQFQTRKLNIRYRLLQKKREKNCMRVEVALNG